MDPEVTTFGAGKKVARITVATTETYKKQGSGETVEDTTWHNVSVFQSAEFVEKYVRKGQLVRVVGKTVHEEYEKEGMKRYITKVIASDIGILSDPNPKPAAQQQQAQQHYQQPAQTQTTQHMPPPPPVQQGPPPSNVPPAPVQQQQQQAQAYMPQKMPWEM